MAEKRWPTGIEPHGNGIRIRIWKAGKLFYSETIPGDPYKKADLKAATRRRDDLKHRLSLGLPIREEEVIDNDFFGNLAQSYLDMLEADLSTLLSYKNNLEKYWLPAFQNWLITDIRTSDIKKILKKAKVTNKTKKNILIPLRGVFSVAMDDSMITVNPVVAIKLKKHQKPKIERFSPTERQRIINALSGQSLVYFAVFFGCGLRPSETLALKWSDIHNNQFHIHNTIVRRKFKDTTKTHEVRDVYIPSWVRAIMKDHPTRWKKGYIFLNSFGRPYLDTDVFNGAWRLVLKELAIAYRIPYTCRHTRAAELLSSGVEPGKASRQLGHTLEMFYRTYAEWIDEYGDPDNNVKLEGKVIANEGW